MLLTVSIQTCNRAESLAATLESMRMLRCPEHADYEILVVDNNSSDHTPSVIEDYSKVLAPRLRSVFESRQGLSHARNRALQEARGEIVCFLDDDVKVDMGWLEAICDAFIKYSATVVGGRAYLIYPAPRPVWLSPNIEFLLSCLDYGDEPILNIEKDLFGVNISVLRQVALNVGGFDVNMGRKDRSLASGEETDFLIRIRKSGGIVVYEPRAIVGHIVSVDRLSKRWFLRRAYSGALTHARLSIKNGKAPNLLRALEHTFRCFGSVAKASLRGYTTPGDLFSRKVFAIGSLGSLIETINQKFRLTI